MKEVEFVFGDRAKVPTFIGTNLRDVVVQHVLDIKPDKVLLVCDQASDQLHGDYFAALRPAYADSGEPAAKKPRLADMPVLEKIVMPGGDACKSWHHLTALAEWAFSIGATKKSLIVGFGGGALMNLTGLFASMLYRGTKLVYVPTTFLAMHDVTTSLKTSICFDGRKNNMGSFYAPLKIFIDASFCKTLSRAELFSGLGELAKNAALFGGKHAAGFCAALSKEPVSGEEFALDDETLMSLLALGIDAKMDVLLKDPMERTDGMVFEYGHTVSHAIEKAYGDGTVPHGVGVTYGMLSSSYAAEKLGIMSAEDRKVHDELCWKLLKRCPLPEPKPTIERVMALAMKDSKRGITGEADDEISDVLLRKLGDVVPTKTQNLSKFPRQLVYEWLGDMGFPAAGKGDETDAESLHGPVTDSDCDAMIKTIGCSTDRQLGAMGYESLTVGFANVVYAVTRKGYPLVIKALMELSSVRLERGTVGQADMHAGRFGIGPKVHYAGKDGLVMDRLSGRTLLEADIHKGDFKLLGAIADVLARCHQMPSPKVFREGVPLLWRQMDKMMDVVARRPELIPKDIIPDIDGITSEINAMRVALDKYHPKVVFSHGSMNPSNVMMSSDGTVKLIDWELGGPNYRGFDLMKLFRTSEASSERCMEHFLRVYAASAGELESKDDMTALIKEVRMFEPLCWLEAAVFFLVMPQFKPEGSGKWNELAIHRWTKFKETKSRLV